MGTPHAWALVAAYLEYASLGPSRAAWHLDLFERPARARVSGVLILIEMRERVRRHDFRTRRHPGKDPAGTGKATGVTRRPDLADRPHRPAHAGRARGRDRAIAGRDREAERRHPTFDEPGRTPDRTGGACEGRGCEEGHP